VDCSHTPLISGIPTEKNLGRLDTANVEARISLHVLRLSDYHLSRRSMVSLAIWHVAPIAGTTFDETGWGYLPYSQLDHGSPTQTFDSRLISKRGDINWPPHSPDLTTQIFFLVGIPEI
jgi:hypothetical protein